MCGLGIGQRPTLSRLRIEPQREPERSVADGAGDDDAVARSRTPARAHGAARQRAEDRDRNRHRSRRANGIAAEERTAERLGILAQPARERREPAIADPLRQRQCEQEAHRLRALGREIGQIHPQRLLRHRVSRIVRKEMHIADDRVGLEHQIAAGRRCQRGAVIDEPKRARMGRKRPEITGDQTVFRAAT